jgi:hypothetical protein
MVVSQWTICTTFNIKSTYIYFYKIFVSFKKKRTTKTNTSEKEQHGRRPLVDPLRRITPALFFTWESLFLLTSQVILSIGEVPYPMELPPYPIDSYRLVDVYELVDIYELVFIA